MRFRTLVCIYWLCLSAISSIAQDMEVSPVTMNFQAEPGTIEMKKLMVLNHASVKQAFEIKTSDYIEHADGTKQRVEPGSSDRSCSDWMNINPSIVELNPNEETYVDVIMTVPKGQHSTRWSIITVSPAEEQSLRNADKELSAGIIIKPRIVVKVTQSPKSNKNYQAIIENLVEITATEDDVRKFKVDIVNSGDKIITANVSLVLANIKTANEEKYKGIRERLLPDTRKTVILQLPKTIDPGKYALAAILNYGNRTALEGVQLMIEY